MSKITAIQARIPDVDPPSLTDRDPRLASFNTFTPVTSEELHRLIMSSPNKQCDLDSIPTSLLKLVCGDLCPLIAHIVNSSLQSGFLPSQFKMALVSPRLKKPSLNPDDLRNYRPVSNLSFLSKTLERVVVNQLTQYLQQNDLLEQNQSAYRQHHSTETALLRIDTDIRCAVGNRKVVLMAMLDLSVAFDTVNHDILLHSLSSIGIQGTALKWFESYLKHRSQAVIIQGERSAVQQLSTGIPQGSVLGPHLFTVYTQSLGSLLKSHGVKYHLYADDTQIYVDCDSDEIDESIKRLELCLASVQNWMAQHKLALNNEKTDFIIFGSNDSIKRLPRYTLRVGQSEIEQSVKVKNVGFIMDHTLSNEQQINNICRIAFIQLRNLSRIKCFIDETLIHAFITSRLDYCNALLVGTNGFLVSKLQRLQNACARLLTDTPRFDHITPVLIDLHWLPVKQRIVFKILMIIYKSLHGLSPMYLKELLSLHEPSRDFRHTDPLLLNVPFTRSHFLYSTSFKYVAPRLWNQLPLNIRSSQSLSVFKSKPRTHIFTSAFF